MKKICTLTVFIILLFTLTVRAQCDPDPVVSGDTLLCPNSTGTLSTQEFDTYQWYKREFLNGIPEMIPGATSQSITIGPNDVLYYFWVEVTEDTCTGTSEEVLVDGLLFIPPTVAHTGDYTFDPNTQTFEVCKGDTMFLTLNLPYNTNITWFRNGLAIPDETGAMLAVTETGSYTVQGAPAGCPDYIQPLGLVLAVEVVECVNAVNPEPDLSLTIYPNPVTDLLKIEYTGTDLITGVALYDATGKLLEERINLTANRLALDLSAYPAAMYFLKMHAGQQMVIRKVIKED